MAKETVEVPGLIRAILLDMDGTLLDIDFQGFMDEYLNRMAGYFEDVEPQRLRDGFRRGVREMVNQQGGGRTVLESFASVFFPAVGLPPSEIKRFWTFYEEEFPRLAHWGRPMPGARRLVEAAFEAGLTVAIATAPMFPEIAIRERLRWAGVDHFPYDFITSSERMHANKPYRAYFEEIADRLEIPSEACLMIGDELEMDGAAVQAQMRVKLVGPEKPSHMAAWAPDLLTAAEPLPQKVPRYPDHEALLAALQAEGLI